MNRTEALTASDSFDWKERLRSIRFVGEYDDDECRRAIVRLLTDKDVAVCDESGRYLVEKNEVKAAELLFTGIAISNEHQSAWTLREIRNAWKEGRFDLEQITDVILSEGDFLSRSGVRDVLRWLGLDGLK